MTCVTGCRECDGCMSCQERQNAFESIGQCAWCGEAVRDDDDRFEFPDGTVVHDDCMLPYVEDRYYHRG